jgi:hypothetical protein
MLILKCVTNIVINIYLSQTFQLHSTVSDTPGWSAWSIHMAVYRNTMGSNKPEFRTIFNSERKFTNYTKILILMSVHDIYKLFWIILLIYLFIIYLVM